MVLEEKLLKVSPKLYKNTAFRTCILPFPSAFKKKALTMHKTRANKIILMGWL